jgi:hypothetical protein
MAQNDHQLKITFQHVKGFLFHTVALNNSEFGSFGWAKFFELRAVFKKPIDATVRPKHKATIRAKIFAEMIKQ